MRNRQTQTIAILTLVGLSLSRFATAQESAPSGRASVSPLGVRQQRVERMLEDLERKFKSLSATLQQTEPERAAKLDETLQETRRLLLAERMTKITELLDQTQLDSAGADQKMVLSDIRQLLALLLDEKDDREKNREEYDRLNAFKKQLEHVLQQERGEKREADKLADKDATLAALQARIAAVEALIEKQCGVVAATEAARGEGVQALAPLAEQQQTVRGETEKVAREIAQEAGDGAGPQAAAAEGGASLGEPGEAPPGSSPPGEQSPMPPTAGGQDGGQPDKSPEKSPSPESGQPAPGGSPASGSPAGGSPAGGGQSGGEGGKRGAEPGEKALRQAAENQRQAEGNLAQGKGKAAQQQEETALANLQRALADLKNESARIASLPPEAFEKMAGKQEDLASQTGEINESMKKPPKAGGSEGGGGESGGGESGGGESGGGESGGGQKPTPGQQKVQQAQGSMQKAAGDLRQQDPADAARQQQRAIKDLEEALREIEERLAQLREETQIEKLAKLEARFREMLARQQKATSDTAGFEAKRQAAGGELKRSDRLAIGKIAAEELSLSEASQQALDIIIEDGTSVVFADVVEQLRDDLQSVAKLLDEKRTEVYTTTLQKEVEITLEELIEALQKAQKQKEASSGGGGGGGGGDEPLLPSSAELKLLRSAQLRINRRTVAVDTARTAESGSDVVVQELQGLSRRQAEIGEMTIRILERGSQQ